MNYTFQFGVALAQLPELLKGAAVTFELGLLTFFFATLIGLLGASLKTYGGAVLRRLAVIYVIFFTNTPALIQIYFLYFGLPEIGIRWSSFTCTLIGLTLNAGAYLTEIMRAGFISVRRTEMEAAETLGMSVWQQIRFVIVPHIAKAIYPALANFFVVILVMGTSVGAVIGVDELTGTAINISTENYRWIEMFVVVAGLYVVLTLIASLSLALVGRMGLPRPGEGVLMLSRLAAEIPRFFTLQKLVLLLEAMGTTLAMTAIGCILGFLLAFGLVFLRQTPGWLALPLRLGAILYVEIFRRIPFLVVIYLVLFFIQAFVSDASLFSIAVIAICIYSTAYTADIIRGGFESVARQQMEAAAAMNFSRWQTLVMVVVPQSWPVILPPAVAFAVGFIKDTALVSQVGVFELTFRGKELNNEGFSGLLVFGTIAFLYFAMSYPLSRWGGWLEQRLASSPSKRPEQRLRAAHRP